MDVEQFAFALPERLIALRPARPRDSARLMVVRPGGELEHQRIADLPDILAAGDVVVMNDTKVWHGRLMGRRAPRADGQGSGPKIEVTLHRRLGPGHFRALAKPARKLAKGDRLLLGQDLLAQVTDCGAGGHVELRFDLKGQALESAIAAQGAVPLPPYIAGRRPADAQDEDDYQTVIAKDAQSAAAPTAGLHFTPGVLARLSGRDVGLERITLHVGAATFLPVAVSDTDQHIMHAERAQVTAATAARLNAVREAGGRLMATGTTTLRTLESAADEHGQIQAFDGDTDIFITPGYRFRAVDMLLTNFHLPRSTLFMLVCAFSGTEVMKRAYEEAIRLDYRFYSYGDACLLMGRP